jgi:hypothetical protein
MPASLFRELLTAVAPAAPCISGVPGVRGVPPAQPAKVSDDSPSAPAGTPENRQGVLGVSAIDRLDLTGTPGTRSTSPGVLDETGGFPREHPWNTENTNKDGDREYATAGQEWSTPLDAWGNQEEERAAIVEHSGKIPRDWAEGFARLHPARPPRDVPLERWQQFLDDIAGFMDGGWAERAARLGWGPLDLFGCDRYQPFARIDYSGILWLLNGSKLVELDRHRAIIERGSGVRQTYRRKPVAVGEVVVPWELTPSGGADPAC